MTGDAHAPGRPGDYPPDHPAGHPAERRSLRPEWRRAVDVDGTVAAIHRVRNLHFPYRGASDVDICAHCSMLTGDGEILWPCSTIRAIEGR